ncbi:MAG: oligosaccharide flippase family protein [Propionibacteriaceae bacterium]|nr:oligosaccharide flippase family protein [Propionibacteriaceae bacterium]
MTIRSFLVSSRNIDRASTTWNAVAGLVSPLQSVLTLVLISVFLGETQAGVYSIATAQAYLVWTIGAYGMRRFQASDVERRFSFREYVSSRAVTGGAMIVAAVILCGVMWWTGGYSPAKVAAVMLVTLLRVVDAVEDVIVGYLQQVGRLDVGAKVSALRLVVSTAAFMAAIVAGAGLLLSLGISLGLSVGSLLVLVGLVLRQFLHEGADRCERGRIWSLLKACFPLFLGSFLTLYISNAPKYGIDAVMDDQAQARFNYLSMPAFVIQMFAMFAFNPLIYRMAQAWIGDSLAELTRLVRRVLALIAGVTTVCLVGGALVGLPVLSWLYHTDLSGYFWELIILLAGGGFVAVAAFLSTVLTIIRYQRVLLIGYAVSALFALSAGWWIRWRGLLGASLFNGAVFVVQCVIFAGILGYGLTHRRIRSTNPSHTPEGV